MALPINLRATAERWIKPTSIIILTCAGLFFWPGVRDQYLRARPWIAAELEVVPRIGMPPLIGDRVTAGHSVSGQRHIWMEDRDGAILCIAERNDIWSGERSRIWTPAAMFERACEDTTPRGDWRVCTRFLVHTDSGREEGFGPYCSPYAPGRLH